MHRSRAHPGLDRMKTPDFRKRTKNQFDVEMILYGKQKLYAHKVMLCLWSKWFEQELSQSAEEESRNPTVVGMHNYRAEDMAEFLAVIYPPNRKVSDKNVGVLLKLSETLEADQIRQQCEEYLMQRRPSIELYDSARHYGLLEVQDKCLGFLKTATLRSLEREPNWANIKDEHKFELLQARMTYLEEKYEQKNRNKWTVKLEEVEKLFTDILNAYSYEEEEKEMVRNRVIEHAMRAMDLLQDASNTIERPYTDHPSFPRECTQDVIAVREATPDGSPVQNDIEGNSCYEDDI